MAIWLTLNKVYFPGFKNNWKYLSLKEEAVVKIIIHPLKLKLVEAKRT